MSEYRSFRLAPEPVGSRAWWLLFPLFGILVALILLFSVFMRPGRVNGDSMVPTLYPEERYLSTLGYSEPHRGDIVVFEVRDPRDQRIRLVKRVVGVPGDTIIVQGDDVLVNGERLGVTVVDSGVREPELGPILLDAEHVFVMGDNRPVALDSRQFGPVPLSSISNRALAVFWPPSKIRMLR